LVCAVEQCFNPFCATKAKNDEKQKQNGGPISFILKYGAELNLG